MKIVLIPPALCRREFTRRTLVWCRTVPNGYNMGRKYFMKAPDADTCQQESESLVRH